MTQSVCSAAACLVHHDDVDGRRDYHEMRLIIIILLVCGQPPQLGGILHLAKKTNLLTELLLLHYCGSSLLCYCVTASI